MTEFQPGDRVQIQDRDREPLYYPYATVIKAQMRGQAHFTDSTEPGYLLRYDEGGEGWYRERDVLTPQADSDRATQLAKRIWPHLGLRHEDAQEALSALVDMAGGTGR